MTVSSIAKGGIAGYLHHPAKGARAGLVLTHGAGANCDAEFLRALAISFCQADVLVLRCDLPFRQKRPSGPPRPGDAALDRKGLTAAIAFLRTMVSSPIYLGGHSYGGRQASLLAAEEPQSADALLLLSYPLHPPAKPDQLRTAHWPSLRTPAFFVLGSKDPFASPDELTAQLPLIPASKELVVIDGAGHDLKRGKFDLSGSLLAPFLRFTGR